jgi:hypothetical protein
MANPEHLAKLKEGVGAWNKWRKDNPEIKRDLTEADLEGANFTGTGNLEVEQLCQAKTLYKVQLDQTLEKQAMGKCPHLLEAPKDEMGPGK